MKQLSLSCAVKPSPQAAAHDRVCGASLVCYTPLNWARRESASTAHEKCAELNQMQPSSRRQCIECWTGWRPAAVASLPTLRHTWTSPKTPHRRLVWMRSRRTLHAPASRCPVPAYHIYGAQAATSAVCHAHGAHGSDEQVTELEVTTCLMPQRTQAPKCGWPLRTRAGGGAAEVHASAGFPHGDAHAKFVSSVNVYFEQKDIGGSSWPCGLCLPS